LRSPLCVPHFRRGVRPQQPEHPVCQLAHFRTAEPAAHQEPHDVNAFDLWVRGAITGDLNALGQARREWRDGKVLTH